jgi:hypothetical protein
MQKKSTKRIRALVCPQCGGIGTLRTIIFGMPDPAEFDFDKYEVGGCCISEDGNDPDVACRACGWIGLLTVFLSDRS